MDFDNDLTNYSRLKKHYAPCPECGLQINEGEVKCFHCSHVFSAVDFELMEIYAKKQKRNGILRGIIIFPITMLLLYFVFLLFK